MIRNVQRDVKSVKSGSPEVSTVLINGYKEPSYPSSTVLLVLSVMPTLIFQIKRRSNNKTMIIAITVATVLFSLFMAIGRLVAGVHWFTDIVGAALLSTGLYLVYKGFQGTICGRAGICPFRH